MLTPVGPHNPAIYWIRRAIVAAVAVLVIIGGIYLFTGRGEGSVIGAQDAPVTTGHTTPQLTGVLAAPPAPENNALPDAQTTRSSTTGANGENSALTTSNTSDVTTTDVTPATTENTDDSADDGVNNDADDVGDDAAEASDAEGANAAADAAATTATTQPTSADKPAKTSEPQSEPASKSTADKAAKTTEQKPPTEEATAAATTTAPATPTRDAQGRLLCPDSAITVSAFTPASSYPVGSQPRLGMTITHTSGPYCWRDVSGAIQTYTVYDSDGERIWSTDDCFPGVGHETLPFAPGNNVNYVVVWAGTSSTPGCDTPRVTVPAGSYTLVASLGALEGKPHTFTMK